MNGKEITASSSSKHPLVIKILIDLDEYRRLKNLEKLQKEVYSKKQKELQSFKPEFVNNLESSGFSQSSSEINQSGGGGVVNRSDKKNLASKVKPNLQETLKLEFENFTKKLYSDLSKSGVLSVQQGAGTSNNFIGYVPAEPDLITSEVEEAKKEFYNFGTAREENLGSAAPAEETFVAQKDIKTLPSVTNVQDLISLVPPNEKSKASKIVQFCLQNPDLISWDTNKVLTVINTTYPKSNIKTYLRRLYVRKKSKDLSDYPGLIAFISVLLSSGLGHLFYKKNFVALSRNIKQKSQQKISTDIKQFKSSPWYFLNSKAETLNAND